MGLTQIDLGLDKSCWDSCGGLSERRVADKGLSCSDKDGFFLVSAELGASSGGDLEEEVQEVMNLLVEILC